MSASPPLPVDPQVTVYKLAGTDFWELSCSACPTVDVWDDGPDRLQREAHRHATEVHDGLVEAVGWVR